MPQKDRVRAHGVTHGLVYFLRV